MGRRGGEGGEVVWRGDTNDKREKNNKIKMTRREPSRKGDRQNIRQNQKEVTQTKDQLIIISNVKIKAWTPLLRNRQTLEVDEMDRRRGEGFQGLAEFVFFDI